MRARKAPEAHADSELARRLSHPGESTKAAHVVNAAGDSDLLPQYATAPLYAVTLATPVVNDSPPTRGAMVTGTIQRALEIQRALDEVLHDSWHGS